MSQEFLEFPELKEDVEDRKGQNMFVESKHATKAKQDPFPAMHQS